MAFSLPQFILLKSSKHGKYLRYRKEDDSNHAFLQFSADEKEENVEIQYVKFEVQKSETLEGFVHIRSCYNHKYWVRKSGGDESKKSWIAAEANEPEEDPSKMSCTLFKPVLLEVAEVEKVGEVVEGDKAPHKIRLFHMDQVGQQGCVAPHDSDFITLQGHVDNNHEDDVFIAYNADSAILLPDRVVVRDHQGMYNGMVGMGSTLVDFILSDFGEVSVIRTYQYPLANPPYVEFRYFAPLSYWCSTNDGNLVTLSAISGSRLRITLIRLAGNKFAFHIPSLGQFRYLNRVSAQGNNSLLGTTATTIVASAIFGVEEPVLLRNVRNVIYQMDDSRVYNVGSVDMFRDHRTNRSSVEQTGSFSVSYTRSRTMSWGDSLSATKGVAASMSASIPFVGISFGVELSEESSQTVEFGNEESEEETVEFSQNVTIPPGKKITLLVVATRAQCDVPFRCTVTDTLTNGTIRTYSKRDGLFTGANEFSFVTKIIEEDA